jgi:hypothetical protein
MLQKSNTASSFVSFFLICYWGLLPFFSDFNFYLKFFFKNSCQIRRDVFVLSLINCFIGCFSLKFNQEYIGSFWALILFAYISNQCLQIQNLFNKVLKISKKWYFIKSNILSGMHIGEGSILFGSLLYIFFS